MIVPSSQGETIEELHDRCAYALHRIIAAEDAADSGVNGKEQGKEGAERAVLLCTHAATLIAIGRALTGRVPDDLAEDDFQTYTCGLSKFVRRRLRRITEGVSSDGPAEAPVKEWRPGNRIPQLDWKQGNGVGGGWDCVQNSDCSFLKDGAERGW